MAGIVQKNGCSIILMRNEPTGKDTVGGCREQFVSILKRSAHQGLDKKYILLDAGLGFGDLKTGNYKVSPGSDPHANILLIINIDKYSLGMPVVIGASRKRFIGDMTGVENAKDRLAGSIAAAVMAKEAGASIVRVHDVAETASAFRGL
jgi:dihydropteroate synthase